MTTKTVNLYEFNELSDKAKEKAREWWRECEGQDFGGFGELNEPIETAARLLGIDLKTHDVPLHGGGKRSEPNVWWTLHVQGAGASFDATYSYAKGCSKEVSSEFPQDAELRRIAEELTRIQRRYAYGITASIEANSRDGHFLGVDLEADRGRDLLIDDIEAMRELFRDFARWIYQHIDAEWTYRMSDENVDESIQANGYTFTVDGKREDV